jgi:pSer/pThr/pTyr-binding forkhead associated (FHA) protein
MLPDPMVSGFHAVLEHGSIRDRGSTNGALRRPLSCAPAVVTGPRTGTHVNGTEIPKETPWPLKAGDVITMGDSELRVGKPLRCAASASSRTCRPCCGCSLGVASCTHCAD